MTEFPAQQEGLAIPDTPQALVGDGRVDDRIGDRAVPHEGLQGPGINPRAPQGHKPGRVPEHEHGSGMAAWRPRQGAQ